MLPAMCPGYISYPSREEGTKAQEIIRVPRAPRRLVAGLGLRLVAQGCLWVLQCRRSRHWQLPIPAEPLHPIPGISPERPDP